MILFKSQKHFLDHQTSTKYDLSVTYVRGRVVKSAFKNCHAYYDKKVLVVIEYLKGENCISYVFLKNVLLITVEPK